MVSPIWVVEGSSASVKGDASNGESAAFVDKEACVDLSRKELSRRSCTDAQQDRPGDHKYLKKMDNAQRVTEEAIKTAEKGNMLISATSVLASKTRAA